MVGVACCDCRYRAQTEDDQMKQREVILDGEGFDCGF